MSKQKPKKISKKAIFRYTVQIISFFVLPGLFDLTFAGLKHAYQAILKGNTDLAQILPDLLEASIVIPATVLLGRFFCGWLCAFGTFTEFIYAVGRKIFKIKYKISARIDAKLKHLKIFLLFVIVIFVWASGNSFLIKLSPWQAFAQIGGLPEAFIRYTAAFLVLLAVIVGAMFVERFFCRYLCPLGAIFSFISRARSFSISKPNSKCGPCRICTNNCSMGIELYKGNKVSSGECINCFKCIDACPKKNTHATIFNRKIDSSFASAAAITAFAGLYSLGASTLDSVNTLQNLGSISASSENGGQASAYVQNGDTSAKPSSTPVPQTKNTIYNDGTYTGIGVGHRSGLKVSVTVSNDRITNIKILSSRETPAFSRYVFSVVPREMIDAQSADVDVVSGATETSDGLIMAVRDALSQAQA